jgi:hypothetical protein
MRKERKKLSFKFDKFRVEEFRTLFFLIILITVLTFIGYIFKDVTSNPVEHEETFLIVRSVGGTTVELINPGKTPLDILMEMHVTQLEEGTTEIFIKCIDNVCGGEDYNWMYYLNEEKGYIKINEYVIQEGDYIEFKLVGSAT